MTIKVLPKQSFLDIAIQHTGNVLNAFEIAFINNMVVSDTLTVGQSLIIPESNKDSFVLNQYKRDRIEPATSFTNIKAVTPARGIGVMRIESNFKID